MARDIENCPGTHVFCSCEREMQDRLTVLDTALTRLQIAWDELCRCTDEFMPGYPAACSEYQERLDSAICGVLAAHAGADARERVSLPIPPGRVTTGRVVARGERPPLVLDDDGADAGEGRIDGWFGHDAVSRVRPAARRGRALGGAAQPDLDRVRS